MKKLVSHLKSPKVMIFSFTRNLSSRILDSLFRFITCSPVPGRGVAAPPAGAETKPHSENFTLTFNTSMFSFRQLLPPAAMHASRCQVSLAAITYSTFSDCKSVAQLNHLRFIVLKLDLLNQQFAHKWPRNTTTS